MRYYAENFNGKVVVITGGGRGIGRAIAEAFAKEGACVACLATTSSQVEEVAEGIRARGGQAIGLPCDVTNYSSIEATYSKIAKEFGGIDILLINAGVDTCRDMIGEEDMNAWKRTIDVNLYGAYFTARAAIPYLKARGGGKIIAMGSGLGVNAGARSSSYAASKAGLRMLMKCLALELKEFNIACNEMYPGPTMTVMNEEYFNGTKDAVFFKGEWLKQPEQVAPLALFIASLPNDGTSAQLFSLTKRDI